MGTKGRLPPVPGRLATRGWWLRQLHLWHWLSGAVSLAALLFFALTGFVLNHPELFSGQRSVQEETWPLPPGVQQVVAAAPISDRGPLPPSLADWLAGKTGEPMHARQAEWSRVEAWIDLPRPGGEGTLILDRVRNEARLRITRRGWIAVVADLHKGRDTGSFWSLVIDATAIGAVLFALSGFAILGLHARGRPATWPVSAAGLVLPVIVYVLFVHV